MANVTRRQHPDATSRSIPSSSVSKPAEVAAEAPVGTARGPAKSQQAPADRFSGSARGSQGASSDEAVRDQAVSIRSRRKPDSDGPLSDAAWRKEVQKQIKTKGIWGPSTEGMTKTSRAHLPPKLQKIFDKDTDLNFGEKPSVFTAEIAGRKAYLFQSHYDGFTGYSLHDSAGRGFPLGRDLKFEAEEQKRAEEEFEKNRTKSKNPTVDQWLKLQGWDEEGPYLTPAEAWTVKKPEKQLDEKSLKAYRDMGEPQVWKNPKDGSLLFRDYDGTKDRFSFAVLDKGKVLERFTL